MKARVVSAKPEAKRGDPCLPLVLAILLALLPLRRAAAADRLDFKTMYYQEDNDRIRVITPTALYEVDLTPTLTLKIEGIYNSISGATPTGAPPSNSVTTTSITTSSASSSGGSSSSTPSGSPSTDEDDGEEAEENEVDNRLLGAGSKPIAALSGATQSTTTTTQPSSSSSSSSSSSASTTTTTSSTNTSATVPKANLEDQRTGFNVELSKRFEKHTLSGVAAYSTENDYRSYGISAKDTLEFNRKNTALTVGGAGTFDQVLATGGAEYRDKNTYEILLGLSQVLGQYTVLKATLTQGWIAGYLDDPYKVVELNGVLTAERRPDHKTKTIGYVELTQFIKPLNAGAELGYRYYTDSFGIDAHTASLAWRQKIGRFLIVVPSARYYDQTAADFYAVRFTGAPLEYSSDYRLSACYTLGYGLKLVWNVSANFAVDLAYERYELHGKDRTTSADAYSQADVYTAGVRLWF